MRGMEEGQSGKWQRLAPPRRHPNAHKPVGQRHVTAPVRRADDRQVRSSTPTRSKNCRWLVIASIFTHKPLLMCACHVCMRVTVCVSQQQTTQRARSPQRSRFEAPGTAGPPGSWTQGHIGLGGSIGHKSREGAKQAKVMHFSPTLLTLCCSPG